MEGADVTTALDGGISALYLEQWPVFVRSGVVSLGISCTPIPCSPRIRSEGLGMFLSRCSSLSHRLPGIDRGRSQINCYVVL